MTQERLMERLWLMLQPYGWELREGKLVNKVKLKEEYGIIDGQWYVFEVGLVLSKEKSFTSRAFKVATILNEYLECDEGGKLQINEQMRTDAFVVNETTTLGELLFHCTKLKFEGMRFHHWRHKLRKVCMDDLGREVLDYEIFQEEGDLEL